MITIGASDLVMTTVSGPAVAATGDSIIIENAVFNQGTGSPTRDFYVRVYLSLDNQITTSDIGLGSRLVSALPVSATDSANSAVTIPDNVPPDTYFVGAIADVVNQVPESSEANNTLLGGLINITTGTQSFPPTLDWENRFNGPADGNDLAGALGTDAAGNIYVAGEQCNKQESTLSSLITCDSISQSDLVVIKYAPDGTELWREVYDSGLSDHVVGMTVDPAGNATVILQAVTTENRESGGTSSTRGCVSGQDKNKRDLVFVKYSASGTLLRAVIRDSSCDDLPLAMAVDGAGNVSVTGFDGSRVGNGGAPVKFDLDGNVLWANDLTGNLVAADAAGNTFVVSRVLDQTLEKADFLTAKFDPAGNLLWERRYSSGIFIGRGFGNSALSGDVASTLTVDEAGNIYVAGASYNGLLFIENSSIINPDSNSDFVTVKYDPNGTELWVARYDFGDTDGVNGVMVDASGNVYVTGRSIEPPAAGAPTYTSGSATVKYSSDGTELWVARYRHGGLGRTVIGPDANIYVLGTRVNGVDYDYTLVSYDPEGNRRWEQRFNAGSEDIARSMVLDSSGVTITGSSANGSGIRSCALCPKDGNWDFSTIKLIPSTVAPLPADLTLSALSTTATTVAAGNTIDIASTVANGGTGAADTFEIAFFLSPDPVYDGENGDVWTRYGDWPGVLGLAAGASSSEVTTVTILDLSVAVPIPQDTPPGDYYICAMADFWEVVPESDETNNTRCTTATITVQ